MRGERVRWRLRERGSGASESVASCAFDLEGVIMSLYVIDSGYTDHRWVCPTLLESHSAARLGGDNTPLGELLLELLDCA
jgi:hypothetical protein